MKPNEWTYNELYTLRQEYQVRLAKDIAATLGRTENAVFIKVRQLGLKKGHFGIKWTPRMIKMITDFYPVTFNRPLAAWLGVSVQSLIRKARELGLEKMPDFLERRHDDIIALTRDAVRRSNKRRGVHGTRKNFGTPFEKGHKESPEVREKRIAAIKESWRRRKQQDRFRKEYNINA